MNKYRKFFLALCTVPKLGFFNVAYVAWYRFTLKIGLKKLLFKSGASYEIGNLKTEESISKLNSELSSNLNHQYEELKSGLCTYFSLHKYNVNSPPKWSYDPFNNYQYSNTDEHWCDINEFSKNDIKIIWELSRFQWFVVFARHYKETGDKETPILAKKWLQDWVNNNPLNLGPQWKCGQECSLRILHLTLGLRIFSKDNLLNPDDSICKFIYEHANRVNKNLLYACAQDNNHGTSEALGLFIAGCILERSNIKLYQKESNKYKNIGRSRLEERVNRLISNDGSFSQRSTNYHRLLLDTLSMAEFFRIEFNEPTFSSKFYTKAKSSITWLHNFIANDTTGEAPNFGHNDGAMLLSLTNSKYRDFRTSVNLCSSLFNNFYLYKSKHNEELESALNLAPAKVKKESKKSIFFSDGGYAILRQKDIFCFLHVPIFKFRPSQNDILHLDIWKNGVNICPDSGTYSYKETPDLAKPSNHNTPQVKELCLPQLGKFLYSKWTNCKVNSFKDSSISVNVLNNNNPFEYNLSISNSKSLIEIKFKNSTQDKPIHMLINTISEDTVKTKNLVEINKCYVSKHYLSLDEIFQMKLISKNGTIELSI